MDHNASRETGASMGIVNLVSGGVDSTLIGMMAKEEGLNVHPLFIDYGQRAGKIEWEACLHLHKKFKLPSPVKMDLSGYGRIISSGLTSIEKDVVSEAFTPGRNLMFLVMAGAFAVKVGASSVYIGLLNEKFSLFPDQSQDFVAKSESAIGAAMGRKIRVVAPLSSFSKTDVLALARARGLSETYSCHMGTKDPCGVCISCKEIINSQ